MLNVEGWKSSFNAGPNHVTSRLSSGVGVSRLRRQTSSSGQMHIPRRRREVSSHLLGSRERLVASLDPSLALAGSLLMCRVGRDEIKKMATRAASPRALRGLMKPKSREAPGRRRLGELVWQSQRCKFGPAGGCQPRPSLSESHEADPGAFSAAHEIRKVTTTTEAATATEPSIGSPTPLETKQVARLGRLLGFANPLAAPPKSDLFEVVEFSLEQVVDEMGRRLEASICQLSKWRPRLELSEKINKVHQLAREQKPLERISC